MCIRAIVGRGLELTMAPQGGPSPSSKSCSNFQSRKLGTLQRSRKGALARPKAH